MTAIFVHPDQAGDGRVQRIVEALEAKGFEILDQSATPTDHVTIAFWTRQNATIALTKNDPKIALAQAGRLVSVLLEKTNLPKQLPKHTNVDLINWRGSVKNAFFVDLVASLQAAEDRAPPPKPRGPLIRLIRRLCGGLTVAAVTVFIFGFALNLLELQNNLCSINFNQPNVSDFCGEYGLGDKPKQEERLAWERREPGSCEALRSHIDRFQEDGALLGRAADLLAASRIVTEEEWVEDQQRTVFSQSIAADGAADEATARLEALRNGRQIAEASCRAFAESDLYKFVSVELAPEQWDCFELSAGHFCGFDGVRVCNLERLVKTNYEICGEAVE